jgi:hypothetical protein
MGHGMAFSQKIPHHCFLFCLFLCSPRILCFLLLFFGVTNNGVQMK